MTIHDYANSDFAEELTLIESMYDSVVRCIDDLDDLEKISIKSFNSRPLEDIKCILEFNINPFQMVPLGSNTADLELPENSSKFNISLYILIPVSYPKKASTCKMNADACSCINAGTMRQLEAYLKEVESKNQVSVLINLFEDFSHKICLNKTVADVDTSSTVDNGSVKSEPSFTLNSSTVSAKKSTEEPVKVTCFDATSLNLAIDDLLAVANQPSLESQPYGACKTSRDKSTSTIRVKDSFGEVCVTSDCLMHHCNHCSGLMKGQFGVKVSTNSVGYYKQYTFDLKLLASLQTYSISHLVEYVTSAVTKINEKKSRLNSHDNIVNFYDLHYTLADEKIYLTMCYNVNVLSYQTLSSLFANSLFGISESSIHKYAIHLLHALYYLHSNNIVHGNLEPCNILVNSEGHLLLVDVFSAGEILRLERHFCQTHFPQKFKLRHFSSYSDRLTCTAKGDVLAYGLILLSLYNGALVSEWPVVVSNMLPNVIQTFIKKCLKCPEDQRPSTQSLLNDYFIVHFEPMSNIWAGYISQFHARCGANTSSGGNINAKRRRLKRTSSTANASAKTIECLGESIPIGSSLATSRVENEFQSFSTIGSGGFGSVISARNKLDSCVYAIKRIKLPRKKPARLHSILKEVQILSKLHHENIVRYYNSWIGPNTNEAIFPPIEGDLDELGNEMSSSEETRSRSSSSSLASPALKSGTTKKGKDQLQTTIPNSNSSLSTTTTTNHFSSDKDVTPQLYRQRTVEFYDGDEEYDSDTQLLGGSGFNMNKSSSDDGIIFVCSSNDEIEYAKAIELLRTSESKVKAYPIGRDHYSRTGEVGSSDAEWSSSTETDSSTSSAVVVPAAPAHRRTQTLSGSARTFNSVESADDEKKEEKFNQKGQRIFFYIQMEYCEKKTLREVIEQEELHKNHERIMKLFRGILEGITYVHQQGLIHRDLKPGNIFINIHDNPKIGDFGLAKLKPTYMNGLRRGQSLAIEKSDGSIFINTQSKQGTSESPISLSEASLTQATTRHDSIGRSLSLSSYDRTYTSDVGTFIYKAPELLKEDHSHAEFTTKSDIYSLGVVFYEMVHAPFKTQFERVISISKMKTENKIDPLITNKTHLTLLDLMLKQEPKERIDARSLLEHQLIPAAMDDFRFNQAIYQVLSNPGTARFQSLIDSLFKNNNNVTLPNSASVLATRRSNFDCALVGAMSGAWSCTEQFIKNHFDNSIIMINPLLPQVIFTMMPYYNCVYDLPPNETEVQAVNKAGELVCFTSQFVKRLGYFVANMDVCKIPVTSIASFADFSYVSYNKAKKNRSSPVLNSKNKSDYTQRLEFCFSLISSTDEDNNPSTLFTVISETLKLVQSIPQNSSAISSIKTPPTEIGPPKKKNRHAVYCTYSSLTVVLNHLEILGKFLEHNGLHEAIHSEFVSLINSNRFDEKRLTTINQFLKSKLPEQFDRHNILYFITFRGSVESFEKILSPIEPLLKPLNELKWLVDGLKEEFPGVTVEVCVDQLNDIRLNAGHINFCIEMNREPATCHLLSRSHDILALGGTSPVVLHKHVQLPLVVSNLSPLVPPSPESMGLTPSVNDSLIISYSSIIVDPIVYLNMLLHRRKACLLGESCVLHKIVVVGFLHQTASIAPPLLIKHAEELSQSLKNSTQLRVQVLHCCVTYEHVDHLKAYYNYLHLAALIVCEVHSKDVRLHIFGEGKRLHEQRFLLLEEAFEQLKLHSNAHASRKDDQYGSDSYSKTSFGGSTTETSIAMANPKKQMDEINYICVMTERQGTASKRASQAKAAVALKPFIGVISPCCQMHVIVTEFSEAEFNFFSNNVTPMALKNWSSLKKEIERHPNIHFNSACKNRLEQAFTALVQCIEKSPLPKNKTSMVYLLFSTVLDRAKILL